MATITFDLHQPPLIHPPRSAIENDRRIGSVLLASSDVPPPPTRRSPRLRLTTTPYTRARVPLHLDDLDDVTIRHHSTSICSVFLTPVGSALSLSAHCATLQSHHNKVELELLRPNTRLVVSAEKMCLASALKIASVFDHLTLMALLLQLGAHIDHRNSQGLTALLCSEGTFVRKGGGGG